MLFRSMLWLAGATLASAQPQDRFPAREHIQPGFADDIAIAAGDLDGDGRDDLVVTSGLPVLHVYLGKATYGIEPAATLDIEAPAVALDLGDFDGDGAADLAFTASNKVFVAIGDGTGGLEMPVKIGFIAGGEALEAADVDADGRDDLVVLSKANSLVKTWLSNPLGGFHPPTSSPLGNQPEDLACGDLNADGVLDLVLASRGNVRVVAALGDGSGSFLKSQSVKLYSGPPVTIALGDLDLDGHLDIVAGPPAADPLYVLRGHGDGTFESATETSPGGTDVGLLDWNGDGYLDVVCARSAYGIAIVLNDQAGRFVQQTQLPSPDTAVAVTSCDADGDGQADVAFAAASVGFTPWAVDETAAGVIHGTGEGQVESVLGIVTEGPIAAGATLVVEDVDEDGILDVVGLGHLPTGGLGSVVVRRGDGAGGMQPSEVYPVAGAKELVTGDVTGDGLVDIVVASGLALTVLEATTTGFEEGIHLPLPFGAPRIAVGDMDGDGDADIVASAWLRLLFWRSLGQGEFAPPVVSTLPATVSVAPGPNAPFEFANLDDDGMLDLLVANNADFRMFALRGLPSGRFVPWGPTEVSFQSAHVLVVDLDEDGVEEVVVSRPMIGAPSLTSTVLVHASDGSGNLPLEGAFEMGPNPILTLACDVDGDAHVDLLSLLQYGQFAWMRGDGAGRFSSPTRFASPGVPIGIGDLDGDGRSDLLVLPSTPPGSGPPEFSYASVLQR